MLHHTQIEQLTPKSGLFQRYAEDVGCSKIDLLVYNAFAAKDP